MLTNQTNTTMIDARRIMSHGGLPTLPGSSMGCPCGELASLLFEVTTQAHISHLQSGSYAAHKAMNELYDGLPDLLDRFVESYQGFYGKIVEYNTTMTIQNNIDFLSYLQKKLSEAEMMRMNFSKGALQQIIDDVCELMSGTIYKLKFLK